MWRGVFRNIAVILALFILASFSYETVKANCDQCLQNEVSESSTRDRMVRVQSILQKNQDYIARNPDAQASIVIKVRSNILMAKVQIETMSNQLTAIEAASKKLECSKCQKR